MTAKEKCFRITHKMSEEVTDLHCTQEEADGRILPHAVYAAVHDRVPIIIVAEDTDVITKTHLYNFDPP